MFFLIFSTLINSAYSQTNVTCTGWLKSSAVGDFATIGDLDVSGNKITVEAMFNLAGDPVIGQPNGGDLISKHSHETNVNYSLFPIGCEITTDISGYKLIKVCHAEPHRTHHVAMVYDGSTLKFYRNGFLMQEIPCTGNIVTNDLAATICTVAGIPTTPLSNQFVGQINQIRIWNVARTQTQLRMYMNTTLPNPTTQPGLLGYYVFDDLRNKQGNSAFDVTLFGGASINQVNPQCEFETDSCSAIIPQEQIINSYTEVLGLNKCTNELAVTNASEFNVGDTVLLIQMKGAEIDNTNSPSFGTITNYNNAGNYEFNFVKSKHGNIIELQNFLIRNYDIPDGKVQLIRVPYFEDYTVKNKLTALGWDGGKGGVLAFNVKNNLVLNQDINVNGKGFNGGASLRHLTFKCDIDSFYLHDNEGMNGNRKGEGIFFTSSLLSGRGKLANGGGGGNSTNSGGAGGGNGGMGGKGGKQYVGVCNIDFDNGGIGGEKLNYSNANNRIFLGGGGGAGQEDDNLLAGGGSGGGIIIISAGTITADTFSISADGITPEHLVRTNDDGRSGGGAGGTVLLNYNSITDNLPVSVKGGNGDNCADIHTMHGPGGGGGGGIVWVNKPSIDPDLLLDINGGVNGVNPNQGDNPWGAESGESGNSLTNLVMPISTVSFVSAIQDVTTNDDTLICPGESVQLIASGASSYAWTPDDGLSDASIYNPVATPSTTTSYIVSGTNTAGCVLKDTVRIIVQSKPTIAISENRTICKNTSIQLSANGGVSYSWTPSASLNDPTTSNPLATPQTNTRYYVTIMDASNCSYLDSVDIDIYPDPIFVASASGQICVNDSLQMSASGGNVYNWHPAIGLDNPAIANPKASPAATTDYTVTITESTCNNSVSLPVRVNVLPLPNVKASSSNNIDCSIDRSQLNASGTNGFTWTPAATLSNPKIHNPVATPVTTTTYYVTGTDANGCTNYDSVVVKVEAINEGGYLMPNAFTPNHDGFNDCYGIKYWGVVYEIEFSIFNRWGQRIFFTKDLNKCWDGTYRGVPQAPGVFIYMIKAKTNCEETLFRKGHFVLIR